MNVDAMEKSLQYGLSIAAELVGEPEPSLHRMHEFIQIRRQAWHAVCSRVRFRLWAYALLWEYSKASGLAAVQSEPSAQ